VRRTGVGSGVARGVSLFVLAWLTVLALAAGAGATATACAWNPVCPYQGLEVLGNTGSASLVGPLAVAVTPGGDVVVADRGKETVTEFTPGGQVVAEIGTPGSYEDINALAVDPSSGEIWVSTSLGVYGFTADGAPEAVARGNGVGPYQADGIAAGPAGTLDVFNGDTSTVYEYSSSGTILAMWPATNTVPAGTYLPVTLAVDGQGNVYVGVFFNVYKFSSSGTPLATLPMASSVASMAISGSTLYAQFGSEIARYDLSGNPLAAVVDPELADPQIGSTFAVTASGIVAATTENTIQELGFDGAQTGGWGGPGLADGNFQAADALEDAAGNVYVIDSTNERVIRYDSQGDPPTLFADLSAYGMPGLAWFDAQGNLVVRVNGAAGGELVSLDPQGNVLSVDSDAGSDPEGTQLASVLAWADNSASDSAGNIYADFEHGTTGVSPGEIAKYSPSGQLIQVIDVSAGWPDIGLPGPIAVDAQGRVYVATDGDDIRIFDPDGIIVAVWPTPSPATSLNVAPNGDVVASLGSTVLRYYDFLDPLPPMPPESSSPFGQEAAAITSQVEAEVAATLDRPKQYRAGNVKTTIDCAGSAHLRCAGELVLVAATRTRTTHTARLKTETVLLGEKSFSIPSGKRAIETVKLNRTARRLLATRATLDAVLAASYRGGATAKMTSRTLVLKGSAPKR
jgi:sugar lactone lactonase YvrE